MLVLKFLSVGLLIFVMVGSFGKVGLCCELVMVSVSSLLVWICGRVEVSVLNIRFMLLVMMFCWVEVVLW